MVIGYLYNMYLIVMGFLVRIFKELSCVRNMLGLGELRRIKGRGVGIKRVYSFIRYDI